MRQGRGDEKTKKIRLGRPSESALYQWRECYLRQYDDYFTRQFTKADT